MPANIETNTNEGSILVSVAETGTAGAGSFVMLSSNAFVRSRRTIFASDGCWLSVEWFTHLWKNRQSAKQASFRFCSFSNA